MIVSVEKAGAKQPQNCHYFFLSCYFFNQRR